MDNLKSKPSDLANCEPFNHNDSKETASHRLFEGAYNVIRDGVSGVVDEITHHPLEVLESGAIGAGIEVAATTLSPVVGASLVGAGIAYAGYQVYKNGHKYLSDLAIASGLTESTSKELEAAHSDLKQIGRDAVKLAAGLVGGGLAAKAMKSTLRELNVELPLDGGASTGKGMTPLVTDSKPVSEFARGGAMLSGAAFSTKSSANTLSNLLSLRDSGIVKDIGKLGMDAKPSVSSENVSSVAADAAVGLPTGKLPSAEIPRMQFCKQFKICIILGSS